MPRGKFVNHKGRNRHFTSPEELEEQRRQDEEKRKWRKEKGGDSSSDDDEDPKASNKAKKGDGSDSDSESESDSDSETEGKAKGVENLIEVENPNRVQKKAKKLSQLNEALSLDAKASKPELSRREREQLEKQRAQASYQKLHAAGKTDEARADLARLAIIKQQREEAAKRRDDEKKQKEMAAQKKTEQTQKALGKRT